MSAGVHITAAAAVDLEGVRGSSFETRRWSEVGVDPRVDRLRWRTLFSTPNPGFRQLDRLGRILCIAVEATGLAPRERPDDDTSLVFGTGYGCLDTDWHFQESLTSGSGVAAKLFPYTLPSTCLGPLAIRYGLRGPTLCFSTPANGEHVAIREAAALIEAGEARRCVLCLGDWIGSEAERALPIESRAQVVALVLGPSDPEAPTWPEIGDLLDAADPVDFSIEHLRARFP
jgi:hypothetical protein